MIEAKNFFFEMFINPDNSDSIEMGIDGTTPVEFSLTCPSGRTLNVARINFEMHDTTMNYGQFGGIAALTNGVNIKHVDSEGNTIKDFTTPFGNLKTNEIFACWPAQILKFTVLLASMFYQFDGLFLRPALVSRIGCRAGKRW